MSFPSGKTLTNFGTQITKGIYARKLYNDETAGLTIETDGSGGKHIDILSGSITLGKLTANKNVMVQEGTLTGQYLSGKTLTDTVAVLDGGSLTSAKRLEVTNANAAQQIWSYDGSNHASLTVSSTGATSIGNSGGDITIDSAGDINLDAAGDNIILKTGGTNRLDIFNSGGDYYIQTKTDSKDLIFRQYDGNETFRLTDAGHAEVKDNLLLKSDAAVLNFGADSDVNLTHVHNTGLLLNDGRQLQFRDSAVHISSDEDGYLNAQADTGVNININGTDELAITSSTATFGTNIIIPNAATIGSVGDTDAISISAGGVVNVSATTDSSSVSTGALTIAGGLGAAKMVTGGSFTDGVATLAAGSITGLVYAKSNTITDGTSLMVSGSITNVTTIGIGVSDPDTKLEVLSTSTQQKWSYDGSTFATLTVASTGATALANTGGDITIDSAGDINLDAAGDNIILKTGGTNRLDIFNSGGDYYIQSKTDSKDLIFRQYDGNETFRLTDAGHAEVKDNLLLKSDAAVLNFGADSDVSLTHVHDTGLLLNAGMKIQFRDSDIHISSDADGYLNAQADAGVNLNIGGTDLVAVTSSNVNISATTASSSTTTGALTVAGGAAVAADLHIGDDLMLKSDNAVLNFGADNDVNLTHVHNTGLLLNSGRQLQFRDSAVHISSDEDGYLSAQADTGVNININGTDELAITSSTATFGTNIVIPNAATIGSAGDTDAISISSGGVVNVSATTDSSSVSTGALTIAGGLGAAKMVTGGSFTDGVATLAAGSITGLVYAKSNTITDGTSLMVSGSITNVTTIGIGVSDPDTKLEVLSTSTQQKWSYDGSTFATLTVASTGATALANTGGDITIDSAGDINIDAAGDNIILKTGGTNRLDIFNSGGDYYIQTKTDSKDLIFRQYDGNETLRLTDAGHVEVKDNLLLKSDAAVLNFGADSDVSLTHVHDTGLLLNAGMKIQFRDSDIHISSDADGYLNAQADTGVNLNIGGTDLVAVTSSNVNVAATTDSSARTNGALTVAGGAGIAKTLFAGTVSCGSFTDGTIAISEGTLTCAGNAGFIEANIGSFTTLYSHDLFVADDMVINGTTTYVNTSQTAFEDELISLGATDGRSVSSVAGAVVTCETSAASVGYSAGVKVLCMQSDGTKEILEVASVGTGADVNKITLTTNPNASTEFIAVIGTESTADGAGIELLAHSGGAARHKTFHYVHNATRPTMEVKSEGAALDLRINNSTDDSYFSVYDNNNHKQLLTSDALFINTSDGTVTNGSDVAALYLSRNGPKSSANNSDENGDWRFRVSGTSTNQTTVLEQYDGSSWNARWQVD